MCVLHFTLHFFRHGQMNLWQILVSITCILSCIKVLNILYPKISQDTLFRLLPCLWICQLCWIVIVIAVSCTNPLICLVKIVMAIIFRILLILFVTLTIKFKPSILLIECIIMCWVFNPWRDIGLIDLCLASLVVNYFGFLLDVPMMANRVQQLRQTHTPLF